MVAEWREAEISIRSHALWPRAKSPFIFCWISATI